MDHVELVSGGIWLSDGPLGIVVLSQYFIEMIHFRGKYFMKVAEVVGTLCEQSSEPKFTLMYLVR